ncbi:hypothetical protein ACLIYM_19760 [Streptomyces fenghuangensis]|uniref:hypothetical protein n=1 Tax=Streptomyces sp. ICN903 TaxID=2964654 RepID=UPI001EDC6A2A|nr:hypothetical protein [Streptomyces sp. ICN903]MCG3039643.1 hypothetical protein [Streptomyces sp. ICN903]
MSTPTEKQETASTRLERVEKDVEALKTDAAQKAKLLEHAETALKPEAIGAAVTGALVASGVNVLSLGFSPVKAEIPTIKDFSPRIDSYLDRKFGWTSQALRTERELERRFSGIELQLELHDTKIKVLGEKVDEVRTVAGRADTSARSARTRQAATARAVQGVGPRRPLDFSGETTTRQVAAQVRNLEFYINRLIAALS